MSDKGNRFRRAGFTLSELLIAIAVLVAATAVLVALQTKSKDPGVTLNAVQRCCLTMKHVAYAMDSYVYLYRERPSGNTDAILAALCGRIPGKQAFLDLGTNSLNGAFVDPWGTPYIIETNTTNGLSIRSAGPNRRLGDADDLEQSLQSNGKKQRPQ